MFFFWALDSCIYSINAISPEYPATAYTAAHIFSEIFDVGAGLILGLLALKLLIPNLFAGIKRESLVVYFLLIWAGGFFFGGVANVVYYAQYSVIASDIMGVLGMLCDFAGGAVLALFAIKLLQNKSGSRLEIKLQPTVTQTA